MAAVRRAILGFLAALLAGLTAAASAQPGSGTGGQGDPLRVEQIDVEEVSRLEPGTLLNFTVFGTPDAKATLQIDGVRGRLDLQEVQPGVYEGSYSIDPQDRIWSGSHVTATLQRGSQFASSVLEEPLLLGTSGPGEARPPIADSALSEANPQPTPRPRVGAPVPPARAAATCPECATVESIRTVEWRDRGRYAGAITGGLLGAILGNQVGRGDGRTLARIVGALGGALAGRELERNGSRHLRYDVVLRLPNGVAQMRQYDSAPPFAVGDIVRLNAASMARSQRPEAPF